MKLAKRFTAVILMLCLLLPLSVCSLTAYAAATETQYSIAAMDGYYKTQGRVYRSGNRLYTDWSASGIEFYADCSGDVYVIFQVDTVDTEQYGGCYFTVLVDGVEKGRGLCCLKERGEQRVKIASGLAKGTHRFELYRQTEIGALVSITGVALTGSLLQAPKENDLYVEFVGDSITVGYGNLAASGTANSGKPFYTNATQGYAYMTAHNKLGADFSLVAVQGIGASVGWQSYTMQEMYTKLRYPKDNRSLYDFARQPDVVVLALGTNDMNRYAAHNMTQAQVKQGFADMLTLVRQKNPTAKIVWIHGMMLSSASPLIQEVVQEAGGAAANVYELRLTQSNSGGNGHPDVAGHASFTDDLSAFIRKLVAPAPTVSSQTDTSVTLKSQSGYEYSRDGKTWQADPTFSGLAAGTYRFYQRKAETSDTAAGVCSVAVTVAVRGAATTSATTTTTTSAVKATTTTTKSLTTVTALPSGTVPTQGAAIAPTQGSSETTAPSNSGVAVGTSSAEPTLVGRVTETEPTAGATTAVTFDTEPTSSPTDPTDAALSTDASTTGKTTGPVRLIVSIGTPLAAACATAGALIVKKRKTTHGR